MSMTDPLAPTPDQASPGGEAVIAALPRDDFDRNVWCLMGLPVDAVDIARAAAAVEDAARTRRKLSFVTPNVNFLVRAARDPAARREILNADLSLADGAPLIMMARLLGAPLRARVAGSDLFEALRRRPAFARRISVFFLGGRDGAAQAATKTIRRENGGLAAAGWLNPGYGDVDSMSADAVIDEINAANPDFVVVALGAEKGQRWIDRNRDRLKAPVVAHLGAVVDFTAGSVRRAPQWIARFGLEWLWRIKEEPALWRRYWRDGMGLARLAGRSLAPQVWRRLRAPGGVDANGRAAVEGGPAETVIRLEGAFADGGLGPVRTAFREAVAHGRGVRLDLSGLESADLAFLGQVLMLEKNLTQAGLALCAAGARRDIAALLRANHMDYSECAAAAAPSSQLQAAG